MPFPCKDDRTVLCYYKVYDRRLRPRLEFALVLRPFVLLEVPAQFIQIDQNERPVQLTRVVRNAAAGLRIHRSEIWGNRTPEKDVSGCMVLVRILKCNPFLMGRQSPRKLRAREMW